MIVKSYTIYKTNLYPSYENVVLPTSRETGYPYSDNKWYYAWLMDALYTTNKKVNNLNRSIKIYDELNASLTVNEKADTIIENGYNYILINYTNTEEPKYKAFFITGTRSLNDNDDNPSCELLLSYDSWGNHWNSIVNTSNKGYLVQGHYKTMDIIDNKPYILNISNDNHSAQHTNNMKMLSIKKPNQQKRAIFLEVVLSNLVNIDVSAYISGAGYTEGIHTFAAWDLPLVNKYSKYVLYIPVCFCEYDSTTQQSFGYISYLYNENTVSIPTSNGDLIFPNHSYTLSEKIGFIPKTLRTYTTSARFTTFVPFEYKSGIATLTIIGTPVFTLDGIPLIGLNPIGAIPTSPVINILPNTKVESTFSFYEQYTVNTNPILNLDKTGNLNKELSLSKYSEPMFKRSLMINGKDYNPPLSKYLNEDINVMISKISSQPFVTITAEGVYNINSSFGTFLDLQPMVTFSIDSLDDYLVRNGSQDEIYKEIVRINKEKAVTDGVIKGIKGGINGITGIVQTAGNYMLGTELFLNNPYNISGSYGADFGMVGGVSKTLTGLADIGQSIADVHTAKQLGEKNLQMITARQTDADNAPDSLKGAYGENDKFVVNNIFINDKKFRGNDVDKEKIFFNEFRYGVLPDAITPILSRFKTSFDYKRFSNIDLSSLRLPLKVINDLISMFKRGVTIHYCDGTGAKRNDGTYYYFLTHQSSINGFNIDTIVNVDKEFRFDENYINWLGRSV